MLRIDSPSKLIAAIEALKDIPFVVTTMIGPFSGPCCFNVKLYKPKGGLICEAEDDFMAEAIFKALDIANKKKFK
jgi:hypothetical protein